MFALTGMLFGPANAGFEWETYSGPDYPDRSWGLSGKCQSQNHTVVENVTLALETTRSYDENATRSFDECERECADRQECGGYSIVLYSHRADDDLRWKNGTDCVLWLGTNLTGGGPWDGDCEEIPAQLLYEIQLIHDRGDNMKLSNNWRCSCTLKGAFTNASNTSGDSLWLWPTPAPTEIWMTPEPTAEPTFFPIYVPPPPNVNGQSQGGWTPTHTKCAVGSGFLLAFLYGCWRGLFHQCLRAGSGSRKRNNKDLAEPLVGKQNTATA